MNIEVIQKIKRLLAEEANYALLVQQQLEKTCMGLQEPYDLLIQLENVVSTFIKSQATKQKQRQQQMDDTTKQVISAYKITLDQRNRELETLKHDHQELVDRLLNLQQSQVEADEIKSKEQLLVQELKQQLNNLEKQLNDAQKQEQNSEKTILDLKEELSAAKKELIEKKEMQERLDRFEKLIEDNTTVIQSQRAQLKSYETISSQLNDKSISDLKQQLQEISETNKTIQNSKEKIENQLNETLEKQKQLQENNDKIENEKKEIQNELNKYIAIEMDLNKKLNDELSKTQQLNEQKDSLKTQVRELQTNLQKSTNDYKNLYTEVEKLKQDQKKLNHLIQTLNQNIVDKNNTIQREQEKYQRLQKQLSGFLTHSDQKAQQFHDQISDLQQKVEDYKQQQLHYQKLIKEHKNQIAQLTAQIQSHIEAENALKQQIKDQILKQQNTERALETEKNNVSDLKQQIQTFKTQNLHKTNQIATMTDDLENLRENITQMIRKDIDMQNTFNTQIEQYQVQNESLRRIEQESTERAKQLEQQNGQLLLEIKNYKQKIFGLNEVIQINKDTHTRQYQNFELQIKNLQDQLQNQQCIASKMKAENAILHQQIQSFKQQIAENGELYIREKYQLENTIKEQKDMIGFLEQKIKEREVTHLEGDSQTLKDYQLRQNLTAENELLKKQLQSIKSQFQFSSVTDNVSGNVTNVTIRPKYTTLNIQELQPEKGQKQTKYRLDYIDRRDKGKLFTQSMQKPLNANRIPSAIINRGNNDAWKSNTLDL